MEAPIYRDCVSSQIIHYLHDLYFFLVIFMLSGEAPKIGIMDIYFSFFIYKKSICAENNDITIWAGQREDRARSTHSFSPAL